MQTADRLLPEKIRELYWDRKMSLKKVAAELGIPKASLHREMDRHGIPRRTHGNVGDKHPQWKGGRISRGGYVSVRAPLGHPRAYRGYILEHRLVMEQHIGRYLTDEEVVHHKNNDPSDNRIENLHLCANQAEHMRAHGKRVLATVPDERSLRELYPAMTIRAIAFEYDCLPAKISSLFEEYGIRTISKGDRRALKFPPKDELLAWIARSTQQHVASSLGVSLVALQRHLRHVGHHQGKDVGGRKNGLEFRGKPLPTAEELAELYKTRSLREIGEMFGCSRSAVQKQMRKHGLATKTKTDWSKQNYPPIAEIVEYLKTKSLRSLAEELGVEYDAIVGFVRRNGYRPSELREARSATLRQ